jgi:hypothetical protein
MNQLKLVLVSLLISTILSIILYLNRRLCFINEIYNEPLNGAIIGGIIATLFILIKCLKNENHAKNIL